MKIFATLLAACAASPTEWIVANWWTEANNVYNFAVGNSAQFASIIAAQDDAPYMPVWSFCGGADGVVTGDELSTCGASMAQFVGMSGGSQNFLYDFATKYWNIVDVDGSNDLDFVEFKTAISALAASNALLAIRAFDEDGNGALTNDEVNKFYNTVISTGNSWGYKVTDGQWAALKSAYKQATNNDGMASMMEVAQFEVLAGNVFLN